MLDLLFNIIGFIGKAAFIAMLAALFTLLLAGWIDSYRGLNESSEQDVYDWEQENDFE